MQRKYGSILQYSWIDTPDGKQCLASLLHRNDRRSFGLLEGPPLDASKCNAEVSYKVFFCGRAGSGKTSVISRLNGSPVPENHYETLGAQSSLLFWPVRIAQAKKTVLVKLHLWEAGEGAMNRYDHILPTCIDEVHAVVFTASFCHKASWEDIPKLIARLELPDSVLKIVMVTHLDLQSKHLITEEDILSFEQDWGIPVLRVANNPAVHIVDGMTGLRQSAPTLNRLCELLWFKDQVKAGVVREPVSYCFQDTLKDSLKLKGNNEEAQTSSEREKVKITFC